MPPVQIITMWHISVLALSAAAKCLITRQSFTENAAKMNECDNRVECNWTQAEDRSPQSGLSAAETSETGL